VEHGAQRVRDEWLALRCQLGEPEAFAALVGAMEQPLLYYIARLLGDQDRAFDVLQEVWLTAFRSIRGLGQPAALRTWLYRIAHGRVVDRLRQEASRDRAEKARAEASPEAGEEPGFGPDAAAAVHRALGEIDWRHREVLVLHFLEDLSVAETAAVVGCPEGTVKSRLYHAKRALKDVLERGGYGPQG
jgi:RNA polymerase sigma-70 factor (ECF subfamily)